MRDYKRGPGLRGNTLVDAGDPAATSAARAPDQDAAGAETTSGPETFDGTIRPDAGTHATGPNPIGTAADLRSENTAPTPILRADTEAGSKTGPATETEAAPGPETFDGTIRP